MAVDSLPPVDLTIRDAVDSDLPAIVALLADDELGQTREVPPSSLAGPVDPAYAIAFAAIEADPNSRLIVAEDSALKSEQAPILGTLQLTLIPGISLRGMLRAQIEGVRVAAPWRRRGLGHQLIGWAIGQAEQAGAGVVQLTSNAQRQEAQRFYESLGFVPTHIGMKLPLGG